MREEVGASGGRAAQRPVTGSSNAADDVKLPRRAQPATASGRRSGKRVKLPRRAEPDRGMRAFQECHVAIGRRGAPSGAGSRDDEAGRATDGGRHADA